MKRPVAVVTGAAGGIGEALATLLAQKGYDLVLHARKASALDQVTARLSSRYPESLVNVVSADLADMNALRALAAQIAARCPKIDRLFNNAGRLRGELAYAPNGVELHAQINLIAPFVLMRELRAPLAAARGVVVNVSSGSIFMTRALEVESLLRPPRMVKLVGPYAQSKLALSALTSALAAHFAEDAVRLVSVDPGPNQTAMTAGDGMPAPLLLLRNLVFKKPDVGARRLVAAGEWVSEATSGCYVENGRARALPAAARDARVQAAVLELCETITGDV